MFFDIQPIEEQKKYESLLKIIVALSKLSSESNVPYLYYRMAENIFCKSFSATNLSRSDVSIDAKKGIWGIGLKTFIHENGKKFEKVAEFNKDRGDYSGFKAPETLVLKISELRNKRLESTCGLCGIQTENLMYHCVTRAENVLYLHEEQMKLIDRDHIEIQKQKGNVIYFTDKNEEYGFNISKSTLYKRFTIKPLRTIDVKIYDDPFSLIETYLQGEFQESASNLIIDTVCLPLYSYENEHKIVPQRSGLNQWNAKGRKRNSNEIYIPIPSKIRNHKPNFFPKKSQSFSLKLPNGSIMSAKICQDGDKALMSNPNEALGKWILRDVLNLQEGTLVSYENLIEIGIDTVQISKFKDGTYEINFKKLGTFETYRQGNGL